jgi:fatty-acyl-CoA synthase
VEGYGLTEATCASVRSFPDAPRAGTVGQRLPYQRISAVRVESDGTWTHLPPGEPGVLAVSGPTVFAGYLTGRDAGGFRLDGLGTLSADGWLDTGDLGAVDEEGFVRLRGRAKDLIIRGGHNIDPAAVEDALLSHPWVTGAAAVGRPDQHAGEVPVAYVTVAPGTVSGESAERNLRAWAIEHVAERAAAPKHVTILDALPVTDVGKPYKLALRARAVRSELSEALAALTGVKDVTVDVDGGSIAAVVVIGTTADEPAVAAILSRYAVSWRVVRQP